MGNRVYEGRFKGSSLTHMPNDKTREGTDRTFHASKVEYVCPNGHISLVHKLELKIARCPECGE
jgi:ferredoxin-like protein FixX